MTIRLLVTGFGPFPGVRRNPSGVLADRVAALPRWRWAGVTTRAVVLPTTYAALASDLLPLLRGTDRAAVLMLGVAARSKTLRVERRAVDRSSILSPDASGELPPPGAAGAGKRVRTTRLGPGRALAVLRRHGLPARLSIDAGRYLCNASYFRALGSQAPVLFVHVPRPPRTGRIMRPGPAHRRDWHDRVAAALAEIASLLLAEARRGTFR